MTHDGLTYQDICPQYHTARFVRDSGSTDKKDGKYRTGVMTALGDLEDGEWERLAEDLTRKNGEEKLFGRLKQWYRNTISWLRDAKELHRYTLECFVMRIHENPEWVDYSAFHAWLGAREGGGADEPR